MKTRAIVCALVLASNQLACTSGGNTAATSTQSPSYPWSQSASTVIGQTSMTSNTSGSNANQFSLPIVLSVSSAGRLGVAERNNSRVTIFNTVPTVNGAAADTVLGQTGVNVGGTTGTAATAMNQAAGVSVVGTSVYVSDQSNFRTSIFNTVSTGAASSFVVGQTTTSGSSLPGAPTASVLKYPAGVAVSGTKMVIADRSFHRVLLYNTIPTSNAAAADVVLGQPDFTSFAPSAATMNSPNGVWTNGTKIVVCEESGHRCLIWNSWPTTNGTPPALVLGQPSISTNSQNNGGISAHSLANPISVTSNGTELVVADGGNNRVLYWQTWPTTNNQSADAVLGQPDFMTVTSGVSATKFNGPQGVAFNGSDLLIADSANHRVLVFKKQ